MVRIQKQKEDKEKEKEKRAPNFKGLKRKSKKSTSSSIRIDPHQRRLYEHIQELDRNNTTPAHAETHIILDDEPKEIETQGIETTKSPQMEIP